MNFFIKIQRNYYENYLDLTVKVKVTVHKFVLYFFLELNIICTASETLSTLSYYRHASSYLTISLPSSGGYTMHVYFIWFYPLLPTYWLKDLICSCCVDFDTLKPLLLIKDLPTNSIKFEHTLMK